MIHVFGENITREELRKIEVVEPAHAGSFWEGMQHGRFVDSLAEEITARRWTITDEKFSTSGKYHEELVGAFDVEIPGIELPGGTLGVGFATSNNRRLSTRIFAGGTVKVCTNGLTSGEIIMTKKHTRNVQIRDEIRWALDGYINAAAATADMVLGMRDTPQTIKGAVSVLNQAEGNGIIRKSYMWDVLNEFVYPSHKEHGAWTQWTLLQGFTEVAKRFPTRTQLNQIEGFRKLITA